MSLRIVIETRSVLKICQRITLLAILSVSIFANPLKAQTACSGTPSPGNTVASVNPVCTGGSTTLSLQNSTSGTGVIYNWQSSSDGTNYTYLGPYIINNATFSSTPANMSTYGSATIASGELQLTNAVAGQIGGAVISTTPGSNITPFTAVFDYRIWDGTGADGLSLSYASNIANDAGTGETGEGSGIILMLDTYNNNNSTVQSQIRINYNGSQVFANVLAAFELRTNAYKTVRLSVDANGYLSLSIGSTLIASNVLLSGYAAADKSNWKFKFSGRTGTLYDKHSIDNLTILMGSNSTISQSLSASTYYKCLVSCANSILNTNSTALQVVASPASVGGTANATSAVITTGTGGSVYLSGYTGSIQWQQSSDNSTWSNVTGGFGANSETYMTPNLTSKTYYKAVVTSGPCSSSTSTTTSISVAPAAPTSVTATPSAITIGGSSNLNATSAGNTINWYDVASGGTALTNVGSGTNYQVSPSANITYYAEAKTPATTADVTLANTATYGVKGVYFDVTAKTGMGSKTITGFPFDPNSSTNYSIAVYYKSGTYSGFQTNSGAWIKLGDFNTNSTSFIDITDITIPANSTYGFYLFCNDYYAMQSTTSASTNSDANVTISGGSYHGGGTLFGNVSTGSLRGGVRYNTAEGMVSLSRTAVSVTVNPAAPTDVTATPSAIYSGTYTYLNATSTGNKINWYETSSGGTAFSTVNSGENAAAFPTTDMTYYAEAMIQAATADVTLTNSSSQTPYGVFFDVTSKPGAGAIIIDGFPMNGTYPNGHQFQVYYKTGTYAGSETNSGAWSHYGNFSRSNGATEAFIDITDLTLPANTTYGFYLFYGSNNDLNSTNSASSSSDANVTISGGSVHTTATQWSSVTTGSFRGGVRYVTVPARLSSTRTPVSVTVTQTPQPQATSVTFNSVQTTQMGISWTNGDGSNRAVFVIEGSSGTVSLNNGTSYPADPVYVVSGFSPNWQCVYNGTGTSVTVTGLKAATTYQVHVCEYNGTEGNQAYNITSAIGNPASQLTAFSELTWDGSESTDWFEVLNWTPETYPDASTNTTIPNTINKPLIADGSGPPMTATCNNITIQSGAVLTIGATGKLTVNGSLTNNAGAAGLVVNSGGSLIEHSGVAATVKRNIASNEWHIISAPISDAKAGMFEGFYLQKHTESTNKYSDITDVGENLIPMQGFALYGSTGVSPALFSGPLNKGSISFTTSLSDAPGEGWNLVGNPYPSSIDWNSNDIVKNNIELATYCHVTYSESELENYGWATFISGIGTNGGSQYFAPCQGFFVKANAEIGSVTMNNGARLHNATTFFKNANAVPNLIRLQVSGNGYKDEAVVRFVPEATAEFDGNYDAHKLFGDVAAAAQVFTTGQNQLSINSLPETNMVPVGVKIGTTGTYTIAATEINDMPYATLEDTKTGIFTELAKSSYTFNFTPGEDEMRFKLHFSALSVDEEINQQASIYSFHKTAYINQNTLKVADIYIYNAAGQLITSHESATGLLAVQLQTSGVYIVKVISNKQIQTKKIFINQ